MTIYEVTHEALREIKTTSFADAGIKERSDLQRLLRSNISVVAPDVLVISEEFGQWEDSSRRIDLLGIDKTCKLVVIELKRTEDGGHMELQAIRYAAMISEMTLDRAIEVYSEFLQRTDGSLDAKTSLLEFLEWDQPDEDQFAQNVRIVLVSAEFSKELTTAVIWLNDQGLDIQCIRLKPYNDNGKILVDVQRIIPLPEAEDYQVRLKAKQQRERAARQFKSDFTKYDVIIDGATHEHLPKRTAIFTVVRHLVSKGHSPEAIAAVVPWRKNSMFRCANGTLNPDDFVAAQKKEATAGGRPFEERRFFCDDDELLHHDGRTYSFTNQWGHRCIEAIDDLIKAFPNEGISYRVSPEQ